MKRYFTRIFIVIFILLAGMSVFSYSARAQIGATGTGPVSGASANNSVAPGGSSAQNGPGVPSPDTKTNNVTLWGLNLTDAVNSFLANIVNALLSVAGFIVSIAAALLNVSIVITLHIKDFVSATPAIYTVWQTLRDITGLFFIFFLLFAAIQMITGVGKGPSYGQLIKSIVIAAILVNFSFFIVSVAIDASNIVSQAIYNAMIPTAATAPINTGTTLTSLTSSVTGLNQAGSSSNPGISNIFTNSLKIQTLYNSTGNSVGTAVGSPFKIILIGVVGILIMITTALSFALAAVAFIARLVILLGLLAFSPIWFLTAVIPQLREYGKKFTGYLSSQLIFMPVYLLLMYMALSILNNSNIMGASNATTSSFPTGTNWAFGYIVLAINFAIVIFMLNLPLVVGLGMGGIATGWMSKAIAKVNAANVWKNFGGGIAGIAGTRTLGRGASWVDKKLANTTLGNSYYGRSLRSVTTGSVASAKYGGSKTWEDKAKIIKDVDKKRKEIDKRGELSKLLSKPTGAVLPTEYRTSIAKMNEKERLALGADMLKNKEVAKHLKGSDYEAIKKSDEFSDKEKKEIGDARKDALDDAVLKMQNDEIKNMVDNMDGKELMKLNTATLTNPSVVAHLKSSHLRTMEDEGLGSTEKIAIGRQIDALGAGGHKSYGFIRKNSVAWT